jgi:hypothetical protein
MAARFFALAGTVVAGLIVADILLHPAGTQAASQGISGIETPVIHGLLGSAA